MQISLQIQQRKIVALFCRNLTLTRYTKRKENSHQRVVGDDGTSTSKNLLFNKKNWYENSCSPAICSLRKNRRPSQCIDTLLCPEVYDFIIFSAPCFTIISIRSCFSKPAIRISEGAPSTTSSQEAESNYIAVYLTVKVKGKST